MRHELNPSVLLIVRYSRNTRVVVVFSCRGVGRNGTAGTVGSVTPQEWWGPSRWLSCRELGGHKSYRQGLFIPVGFFFSSATFNLWPGSDRHLYFHPWATCACVCWQNFFLIASSGVATGIGKSRNDGPAGRETTGSVLVLRAGKVIIIQIQISFSRPTVGKFTAQQQQKHTEEKTFSNARIEKEK